MPAALAQVAAPQIPLPAPGPLEQLRFTLTTSSFPKSYKSHFPPGCVPVGPTAQLQAEGLNPKKGATLAGPNSAWASGVRCSTFKAHQVKVLIRHFYS